MITFPRFIEFLKYTKTNFPETYKEITEIKFPRGSEWIDASFERKGEDFYINYNHIINSNGSLIPKNSEILDKNTLMEDKQISLEDYLNNNHTPQGLPSKKVKSGGDLDYSFPRCNYSVATFSVKSFGLVGRDISCCSDSLGSGSCRGYEL